MTFLGSEKFFGPFKMGRKVFPRFPRKIEEIRGNRGNRGKKGFVKDDPYSGSLLLGFNLDSDAFLVKTLLFFHLYFLA